MHRSITLRGCDTIMQAMWRLLHWLPVKYRVHFKLAVITFNALTRQQPSYLSELLSVHVPRRDLRSGNYQWLLIPRNKLKFTDRAFSHAAPTIWNGLPTSVNSGTFQTVAQN